MQIHVQCRHLTVSHIVVICLSNLFHTNLSPLELNSILVRRVPLILVKSFYISVLRGCFGFGFRKK